MGIGQAIVKISSTSEGSYISSLLGLGKESRGWVGAGLQGVWGAPAYPCRSFLKTTPRLPQTAGGVFGGIISFLPGVGANKGRRAQTAYAMGEEP